MADGGEIVEEILGPKTYGRRARQEEARQNNPACDPWEIVDPTLLAQHAPPEREWVVQDWLPMGVTTACYGDGGVGKTLLAQLLQTACTINAPWCGMAVRQCRTIGLYCEDDKDELHRRQIRMCDAFGTYMSDLSGMKWISGVSRDNALAEPEEFGPRMVRTNRFNELRAEILDYRPELVVLDTAADLFLGDENNRGQVRQFVGFLNGLAADAECSILLNCHPSRSGMGANGDMDGASTAWSNTVRSRWALTRPKDEGADPAERVLDRRKANYSSTGEAIRLRWGGGVLAPMDQPGGLSAMSRSLDAEVVFLALLAATEREGRHVSAISNASTFAPREFGRRTDRQGFTAKDFQAAMERLFGAGRIVAEEYGRVSGAGVKPRRIVAVQP